MEAPIAWQPHCSLPLLHLRAQVLQQIRVFFAERSVLEVETPLLCRSVGTDPNLDFFKTRLHESPDSPEFFLQTSPEFAMKRLLAAGCGSIFQICKAFRNGEAGRFHNPEFTLIEWYRVGFSLTQLMDEVRALLSRLFGEKLHAEYRESYPVLFAKHTGLDCLHFDKLAYCDFARSSGFPEAIELCGNDHAFWLDFIFSHVVQPKLTGDYLYQIHDYPACLPSLARKHPNNPLVTERVEVFINGVELGNGYFELADSKEQETRFDAEIALRRKQGLSPVDKDRRLLAALESGLPDCAGIALGLDRILMLLSRSGSIGEVLAFPIVNA